ncbi:cation-translocating P-type ATPase [Kaarinaea lacus]
MGQEQWKDERLDTLYQRLRTSSAGLSHQEASARVIRYGYNELIFHRSRSIPLMLLDEFRALFPVLLMVAGGLSFVANYLSPGEGYDLIGYALMGVVILNALVSFFQNYKVEKLMMAFLDYIPKSVNVLRDGEVETLDAKELVPGDVLLVQEGDKISADGVVIEAKQLLVDESVLTGESVPAEKISCNDAINETALVFSGAMVVKGSARIIVTRTGRKSKIGEISEMSQAVKADLTPMQKELKNFVNKITWLALGIGLVFFITGFVIGNTFWTNLVFAIGIIVANVPEGLLPTVTLALTQASARMSKRNAVIKDILCVETLGSTTVICTDKTGTLTRNQLHVEKLYLDFVDIDAEDKQHFLKNRASQTALEIMALCNEAVNSVQNNHEKQFTGDPTEVAMANFANKLEGYDAIRNRFTPKHSRAFDPETRFMTTTHLTQGGSLYLTAKGASEAIIERCHSIHSEGFVRPLRENEKKQFLEKANEYSRQGLRVLALAYQIVEQDDQEPDQLVLVGLSAFVDPPRREVPAAVAACKTAGIRIIVMSGDQAETVVYIARRLGIVSDPLVITGEDIETMSHDQLINNLKEKEVVFARIAPEQKLNIVDALKSMDEVVAMTGDGVNDAPALKRADIGVAMGKNGTDVAKEASDIILLDDNFATIVRAVEQGRAVYDNIKKFITYILTSNIPEILPFIAYVLFPIPLPITVVQILTIDLITDILPAIGLGNEPPEEDIMRRPPRRRQERLVSYKTFIRSYGVVGPIEALLSFLVFFYILHSGGWTYGERTTTDSVLYAQAAGAFLITIIFSQIGNVLACRTNRQSAFSYLRKFNSWIVAGVLFELLFSIAIVNVPVFHHFFTTAPFGIEIWIAMLLAPAIVFSIEEIRKLLVRRGVDILAV